MSGGNTTASGNVSTFDTTLQSLGCVDLWDARYGLQQDMGTTNVSRWYGIQGSGNTFVNFVTNFPQYVSTITTNGFPAVSISTTTNVLRCDSLAQIVNANMSQGFTVAVLLCAENSGVAMNPFTFGWSQASNVNASTFRMSPHNATTTTYGVAMSMNTNSQFSNFNTTGGPNTTNCWTLMIGAYSNGNLYAQQNLSASKTTFTPGVVTLDRCCLGGKLGTNDVFTLKWPGYIGMVGVFTNYNANAGGCTNLFWYLSTNYANGYWKVLNSP
jgi:hypothetical protein